MNTKALNKLTDFLNNSTDQRVSLSFEEIEMIIAEDLPKEAKSEPSWWYNKKNNQYAHFWMDAGYRTIDCKKNISEGSICFLKDSNIKIDNTFGEQHVSRISSTDNWISYLSSIFGVIAFLLPNVPPLGKILFVISLIVFNFAFHSPVFQKERKLLRRIIMLASIVFFIVFFSFSVKNEITIIYNTENTLSLSLLPKEFKPLPIKVSEKEDTVDFYCADMDPVIDIRLLNEEDTPATVTSIDSIIKDYEEFSAEDIFEHSWIEDNPYEFFLQRNNSILEEDNTNFSSNYKKVKLDYINVGERVYHDKRDQQLFVIDNGKHVAQFTVDDCIYLRFVPEVMDSGYYTIQLLINYINSIGDKQCKSESISFYFLNAT